MDYNDNIPINSMTRRPMNNVNSYNIKEIQNQTKENNNQKNFIETNKNIITKIQKANNDIDRLEIDADAFPEKKGVKERMVQKYMRKRGVKLDLTDPKEIRNIDAINKSINYLIEEI